MRRSRVHEIRQALSLRILLMRSIDQLKSVTIYDRVHDTTLVWGENESDMRVFNIFQYEPSLSAPLLYLIAMQIRLVAMGSDLSAYLCTYSRLSRGANTLHASLGYTTTRLEGHRL